jgi:hypothetical protein
MPLGGVISLAILLPNLLYLVRPPAGAPAEAPRESRLPKGMEAVERLGQAGCFLLPFFYPLPALREASIDALALLLMALTFYYAGWLRYALKGSRSILLYAPLLGVPLPMAIAPVVYFAAAAILLSSWPLAAATALLAVGHLSVSQRAYRRLIDESAPQPGRKVYN